MQSRYFPRVERVGFRPPFSPFVPRPTIPTGSDQIARDKRFERTPSAKITVIDDGLDFFRILFPSLSTSKSISLAHLSFFFLFSFFFFPFFIVRIGVRSTIVFATVKISRIFRAFLSPRKSMEQLAQRAAASLINPSTSSSMNVALMELTGGKNLITPMRGEMESVLTLSCHFMTRNFRYHARWTVQKSDFVCESESKRRIQQSSEKNRNIIRN